MSTGEIIIFEHGECRSRKKGCHRSLVGHRAFTLVEVMVAGSILFLCLFAILAVFSNSLRSARIIQHKRVDAGVLAAQLSLTNRLEEGVETGDFGDLYPDYRWQQFSTEVSSNGLWQVDFVVYKRSGVQESAMSILLFSPDSRPAQAGTRR